MQTSTILCVTSCTRTATWQQMCWLQQTSFTLESTKQYGVWRDNFFLSLTCDDHMGLVHLCKSTLF